MCNVHSQTGQSSPLDTSTNFVGHVSLRGEGNGGTYHKYFWTFGDRYFRQFGAFFLLLNSKFQTLSQPFVGEQFRYQMEEKTMRVPVPMSICLQILLNLTEIVTAQQQAQHQPNSTSTRVGLVKVISWTTPPPSTGNQHKNRKYIGTINLT